MFWKYAANLQKNTHADVLHIFRTPFTKNTSGGCSWHEGHDPILFLSFAYLQTIKQSFFEKQLFWKIFEILQGIICDGVPFDKIADLKPTA